VKINLRSAISRAFVALLLTVAAPLSMRGQDGTARTPAVVSFAFERVGLPVPKFIMRISEDGSGTYQGEEAPPPSPYPGVSSPARPIDRGFIVSAATASKIFTLAREAHNFNVACASKAKNIADTGKKTLAYKGPDGEGSCTYNYSENKSVAQLTDIFQGTAAMMDAGRQLDHLHRYDRLGLDAALESLAQQVAAGRALEVGTIEVSLRSIIGDTDVMMRARTRASALLALIPAGPTPYKAQ
jgi:hypothetical protein